MLLGSQTFDLEVAATPDTRQTGLMHRDSMPAHHGMIFVFPDQDIRDFWMRNTRIPLDIVYLDSQGTVLTIKQMQPYDLTSISSDRPAKYAIELNQGAASRAQLRTGDTIKVPFEIATTAR